MLDLIEAPRVLMDLVVVSLFPLLSTLLAKVATTGRNKRGAQTLSHAGPGCSRSQSQKLDPCPHGIEESRFKILPL